MTGQRKLLDMCRMEQKEIGDNIVILRMKKKDYERLMDLLDQLGKQLGSIS